MPPAPQSDAQKLRTKLIDKLNQLLIRCCQSSGRLGPEGLEITRLKTEIKAIDDYIKLKSNE